MILQDAYEAAQRYLDEVIRPEHPEEILIARCEEVDEGWSFGYNTRDFLEGGDVSASLVGNGPIFVPQDGGPPSVSSVFSRRRPTS